VFARARAGEAGARGMQLQAEGRLDRDAQAGRWYASHALTLTAARGPLTLGLANRSSYTPPSLGDQFFREGVGVVSNPALRAERVPAEWELSAALAGSAGPAELSIDAAAWTGRVEGMIVWLPDFTFRWSPRNLDVERQGLDLRAQAALPARRLRLAAGWSRARITYAHVEDGSASQLAYRPRHSALLSAEWAPGAWRGELGARYTGQRFPAPSPVNALPGFWSTRLNLGRQWRLGRWQVLGALDLDRVFDERQSLIAGYPEPGRRLRFDLRVERALLSHP
jgi:outer membrane cobalamin receptor